MATIIIKTPTHPHIIGVFTAIDVYKRQTFHLARHTFATTTTLAKGVPVETVSKMLGHTNIETTQIYACLLYTSTRIKATVTATMYDMSRVNANGYFDSMNADARDVYKRQV